MPSRRWAHLPAQAAGRAVLPSAAVRCAAPARGRASRGRSGRLGLGPRAEASPLLARLGSGSCPCLAFVLPFRVIPGPAGSPARDGRRKLRKLVLPELQVGRAGGALGSGARAARYVRGPWRGARVGGCPATPPFREGGDRAGAHLPAWTRPQESCRQPPGLRARSTQAQRGAASGQSHTARQRALGLLFRWESPRLPRRGAGQKPDRGSELPQSLLRLTPGKQEGKG